MSSESAHSIVADHVGAPLVVLDDRGASRAQFVVDTYGRAQTAGDATLCPFRFAGQYFDVETGLHYNRFRHYDPATGQYISRDPLGLRGGMRAYGYVDDPLVATDPLGLSEQSGPGNGCAGAAAAAPGRMTPDQQALKDLVNDATLGGRKALPAPEAETVLDWAEETGFPGARATTSDVIGDHPGTQCTVAV